MKKSIFQILEENFDFNTEINKIDKLFGSYLFFYHKYEYGNGDEYTPEQLVGNYVFHNWKQRQRYINLNEMKNILDIGSIIQYTEPSISEMILYLEYVLNVLYLADVFIEDKGDWEHIYSRYKMLKDNIDILLDYINHEAHYSEDDEMVLIVEKNAAATSAAEIVSPDLGIKIIRYNHYLLKGDISKKRDIILSLADKLEPARSQLNGINKTLADNLFFLFNSMNLRHNNKDKNSKHYIKFVAEMSESQLEEWYDETYQLELLAFLLLDNKDRNTRIDTLKINMKEHNQ